MQFSKIALAATIAVASATNNSTSSTTSDAGAAMAPVNQAVVGAGLALAGAAALLL